MENWQKDFWLILETATKEAEQFFEEVSQVFEEVSQVIEEFVEQVQDEVSAEIEGIVEELFSPLFDNYLEPDNFFSENFYDEEADLLINPKLEPNAEQYPACIGCHHYHGRIYGGNLLVCGMHPYGWEDDNCPDWQGV